MATWNSDSSEAGAAGPAIKERKAPLGFKTTDMRLVGHARKVQQHSISSDQALGSCPASPVYHRLSERRYACCRTALADIWDSNVTACTQPAWHDVDSSGKV